MTSDALFSSSRDGRVPLQSSLHILRLSKSPKAEVQAGATLSARKKSVLLTWPSRTLGPRVKKSLNKIGFLFFHRLFRNAAAAWSFACSRAAGSHPVCLLGGRVCLFAGRRRSSSALRSQSSFSLLRLERKVLFVLSLFIFFLCRRRVADECETVDQWL